MSARRGGWIQTASGRAFYPLDPRPEDVCIADIAHALAQKARYGGHGLWPYSVAQHSVLVCGWVALRQPEAALAALLHDAAEAYLADIPSPVKPSLPGWREGEAAVARAIAARFGLPAEEPAIVKEADWRIVADEKAALMPHGPAWSDIGEPLGVTIDRMDWRAARDAFLATFRVLAPEAVWERWP